MQGMSFPIFLGEEKESSSSRLRAQEVGYNNRDVEEEVVFEEDVRVNDIPLSTPCDNYIIGSVDK